MASTIRNRKKLSKGSLGKETKKNTIKFLYVF